MSIPLPKSSVTIFPTLLSVVLLSLTAPAYAQEPAGAASNWLDARACGASGSEFSTTASATAGAKEVRVAEVGDFQAGQGVMLSECNPRCTRETLWGPRHKVVMGRPLEKKAEIRGYDGSQGDWLVLLLDVAEGSKSFRWSEDRARTWQPTVPITGDWQPLRDGLEVRFNEHEWEKGYTVHFTLRGQLVTVIEKIEGNQVTLRDTPTRTVEAATMRHCDDAALQAAIDRAMKEKVHLYVPAGRYRLSRGLSVRNAESIVIEGADAVNTILDISEGEGACITLSGGVDVTLRNFTMVGHSGFAERDQCGILRTLGSSYFWGFGAKGCNAVSIGSTQRVLVENCHGRRMATECFVSGSRSRGTAEKPNDAHCKQTTYLRCSAIDCGRNAFNDVMSGSENTSVLHCRIVDVGGCAWEGASRFVQFNGNYVRNAGTVAMGNLGPANHDETFPELGAGQHIIADNVFESVVPYGGCAVRAAVGATQVLITNNLFVNFGSSAVNISGRSDPTHYPTATATIAGNLFDMTEIGGESAARIAIDVSGSNVIVSDNQIYVRGACDPQVTAIKLLEPALNLNVHDNLIRNCGAGIVAGRGVSTVAEVVDERTFAPGSRFIPLDERLAAQCAGWELVWLAGGKPAERSVIEAITGAGGTDTVQVVLRAPRAIKPGDSFELVPPAANWTIQDNTVTDCRHPIVLDSHGSPTSIVRNNIITRGGTAEVRQAIEWRGRFTLIGNLVVGFDEPESAALSLHADRLGQDVHVPFHNNVFERCKQIVHKGQEERWGNADLRDNRFMDCETIPETSPR